MSRWPFGPRHVPPPLIEGDVQSLREVLHVRLHFVYRGTSLRKKGTRERLSFLNYLYEETHKNAPPPIKTLVRPSLKNRRTHKKGDARQEFHGTPSPG